MWIALSITCALANALWTALAKPIVQQMSPLRVTLIMRALVAALLIVPFAARPEFPSSLGVWLLVIAIGLLNGARWVVILHGVKRDYFSTYGMYNTAPLFTLLLAPTMLPERFGAGVWLGVLAIIAGGAVFYRTSRFSACGLAGAGLTAAVNILFKRGMDFMSPLSLLFLTQLSITGVLAVSYLIVEGTAGREARWGADVRRIAPLAAIVVVSALAFTYALSLDTATRVTAVARVNLVFGFLLSYLMLREKWEWQWKLAGTGLIVAGTIAVAM